MNVREMKTREGGLLIRSRIIGSGVRKNRRFYVEGSGWEEPTARFDATLVDALHDANETYAPVSVVHPDDVRMPWNGFAPGSRFVWLPRSADEAARIVSDWTFRVQVGCGPSWSVTIPAGSRVWVAFKGNPAQASTLAVIHGE